MKRFFPASFSFWRRSGSAPVSFRRRSPPMASTLEVSEKFRCW